MLKVNSYSARGTKLSSVTLPKTFEEKENLALLAQAIRVYEDRQHPGLAKAKTRAEVLRTKKKLYKQKGTGGARHGSRSAPIFVGGGVAHGPRGVKRVLELPLALKRKALAVAVSLKVKEGQVVSADGLGSLKKTKEANKLIEKVLAETKTKKVTLVLSEGNLGAKKIFRNFKEVRILPYKDINAYDIFFGGAIVFDKEIFVAKKAKKETKK
ncbi:50S ribosomal protein L4 [Candidatus Woesebacteria bacterium RIFCSPHIGHO2_12_FULL_46_16]|uniref:Large ribosomal subunit protein uL4 n=3 Tax=Microgenomates group TaxID=1794810 RepID=A0A0H4TFX3_9BACT|nr:50S ribosomal protein L4/L1e, large subunit ribosomal protein L4 [uncultured Microgenomates bacterium Rifle_16ft_4_minimus_37906]AKQ05562.1 50S ribosomal protein L4/L1e, large subunit ribosomal protein L4 [uncultured Microgenomates bacterium Rifle_16ft_4_minimus_24682]OGM57969.1 MAG: 50S ribosomal protein L4 [Candidatus Woesebacteria bacterium RIFCSPHIGHO2_12_FULL_46_16]